MIIFVLFVYLIASYLFGSIVRNLISGFYEMPGWMMMIVGAILTAIFFLIIPGIRGGGVGGPYQGNDDAR